MADLSGTWLGTYWQMGIPTRFEATLVQSGNTLTGSILDDCYLGEASLTGEAIGRQISFVKRYLTSSPASIQYTGTVNEDANLIQGRWTIDRCDSGEWEARRSGENLTLDLSSFKLDKVPTSMGNA